MLLFGNDVSLLNQFPSFFIDFLVVPRTSSEQTGDVRWVERYSSEQNIMETFMQVYDRLRKRVPAEFKLKEDGFFRDDDVPQIQAIREAFVNLLMHMDYFDAKGATIRIYDDGVELKNAGCLLFPSNKLFVEYITEPRNPIIAKVFRLLGLADRTGEGITKIVAGWQAAGYARPVIKDDKNLNSYRIWLPLVPCAQEEAQEVLSGTHYRKSSEGVNGGVNEGVSTVLKYVSDHPGKRVPHIAKQLHVPQKTIERWIKKLKGEGKIIYKGSAKTGGYFCE